MEGKTPQSDRIIKGERKREEKKKKKSEDLKNINVTLFSLSFLRPPAALSRSVAIAFAIAFASALAPRPAAAPPVAPITLLLLLPPLLRLKL